MKREDFCLGIDPGHGFGSRLAGTLDTGTVHGGMRECDVALDWAKALKYVFSEAGLRVYMTRTDNKQPLPVWKRDDLAELHKCSHFISIHCNSSDDVDATGVETFIRDAGDKAWGQIVQTCGVRATGLRNRGVKPDTQSQHHSGLAVLNFGPPGVVFETGFLSNLKNRAIICRRDTRLLFAELMLEQVQTVILRAA